MLSTLSKVIVLLAWSELQNRPSPNSLKTNHLFIGANSWTPTAVAVELDRSESMREMRQTKLVENLERWPFSHILFAQRPVFAGSRHDWLDCIGNLQKWHRRNPLCSSSSMFGMALIHSSHFFYFSKSPVTESTFLPSTKSNLASGVSPQQVNTASSVPWKPLIPNL